MASNLYSSYAGEAYDFDKFEPRGYVAHGNTAPKKREAEEEEHSPRLKKVAPKSSSQKRFEEARDNIRMIFMLVFVAIIFLVICSQISAGAERYELIRQIDAVEAEIKVAKSENVRLNAELNGITSISKIENYAENVLGMTKVENYQLECVDLSQGDKVLYSGAVR